jgi:hypothetical protein
MTNDPTPAPLADLIAKGESILPQAPTNVAAVLGYLCDPALDFNRGATAQEMALALGFDQGFVLSALRYLFLEQEVSFREAVSGHTVWYVSHRPAVSCLAREVLDVVGEYGLKSNWRPLTIPEMAMELDMAPEQVRAALTELEQVGLFAHTNEQPQRWQFAQRLAQWAPGPA